MYQYDQGFFEYISRGSTRSARAIAPILQAQFKFESVLDVGCGQGAWLGVWREMGIDDLCGLDGPYVDRSQFLAPSDAFRPADLVEPFDLERRFDLVQSLEVAEHLSASAAPDFVASLARHGSVILFSAATPGQGGENHINEQPPDYWRALFREQGFELFDFVRPQIKDKMQVEPWYRYNCFLYIKATESPASLRDNLLPKDQPIPEMTPLSFRLRSQVLSLLPVSAVTAIAKMKHAVMRTRYRLSTR